MTSSKDSLVKQNRKAMGREALAKGERTFKADCPKHGEGVMHHVQPKGGVACAQCRVEANARSNAKYTPLWNAKEAAAIVAGDPVAIAGKRARLVNGSATNRLRKAGRAAPSKQAKAEIAARVRGFPQGVHVDHAVPLSKGGEHIASNVFPVTPEANWLKGDLLYPGVSAMQRPPAERPADFDPNEVRDVFHPDILNLAILDGANRDMDEFVNAFDSVVEDQHGRPPCG